MHLCAVPTQVGPHKAPAAEGRESPARFTHASGQTQLSIHTLSFPVVSSCLDLPFVCLALPFVCLSTCRFWFSSHLCLSLKATVRAQRASLQRWHSCSSACNGPHSWDWHASKVTCSIRHSCLYSSSFSLDIVFSLFILQMNFKGLTLD